MMKFQKFDLYLQKKEFIDWLNNESLNGNQIDGFFYDLPIVHFTENKDVSYHYDVLYGSSSKVIGAWKTVNSIIPQFKKMFVLMRNSEVVFDPLLNEDESRKTKLVQLKGNLFFDFILLMMFSRSLFTTGFAFGFSDLMNFFFIFVFFIGMVVDILRIHVLRNEKLYLIRKVSFLNIVQKASLSALALILLLDIIFR